MLAPFSTMWDGSNKIKSVKTSNEDNTWSIPLTLGSLSSWTKSPQISAHQIRKDAQTAHHEANHNQTGGTDCVCPKDGRKSSLLCRLKKLRCSNSSRFESHFENACVYRLATRIYRLPNSQCQQQVLTRGDRRRRH